VTRTDTATPRHTGSKLWLCCWGALLGIVVSCALAVPGAPAADANPTNVAIGDSITRVSQEEILNRFYAAGWPGQVIAADGRRIDEMRPFIRAVAHNTPSLQRMFIFLGTNNAWQCQNALYSCNQSLKDIHGAVHDVIDIRPKACVFLVTVKEFNFADKPAYFYESVALNNEMRSLDRAFPRVFLIDWNKITVDKNIKLDWIGHPDQTGQWILSDYYRAYGTAAGTAAHPCGPIPPGHA
jgi:GDSL-like lipase/acylhydrolase family protein